MPTNTKESGLETLIVDWLVNHNGYEQGTNADYNRDYAIDETRLFRFLQSTQGDAMDKLGVFKSEQKKQQFLNRLQGEIAKRGIIGQHRTIAEASAVESPIRQETIGFPAHFFARAHNFKPPGRACQPEADSPMRT